MKIADFATSRPELEKLYENACFDPASGLDGDALEAEYRRHLAATTIRKRWRRRGSFRAL